MKTFKKILKVLGIMFLIITGLFGLSIGVNWIAEILERVNETVNMNSNPFPEAVGNIIVAILVSAFLGVLFMAIWTELD